MSIAGFSQDKAGLKLWYNQPSGDVWENALPVGNGRQAAMVYGNVENEIIQLNEHTVWSGSPNRNDNPNALASLPEIRKLIFEGKQKEAEILASKTIQSEKSHGQMFQPVGSLNLHFNGHGNYSDYYRELDIERAVTKTSYKVGDVAYTREVLASFPDQVIVVNLKASKPKNIAFTASFTTPQPKATIKTTKEKELVISGTTMDHEGVEGKVKFRGIARIKLKGGRIAMNDSTLTVRDADDATIYISIASNFNNYNDISGNEQERAEAILKKAAPKSFEEILKAHTAAYQKYFNRVKLDLGTTEAANLPTDARLQNFRSVNDPQLVTLYFQYGRYLLISSSQPGGQPANLQGIWNHRLKPPWDSKYTININAQMNYWPAEKTNLAELHEPFLRMVREMSETGQETARVMYGARGWMAHHNTDIWRITGPVDAIFWGIWSGVGGWTSQHLWEHYLFTQDRQFLSRAWPVMKEAASPARNATRFPTSSGAPRRLRHCCSRMRLFRASWSG
jgi:alpha-L-fucosidase 2